MKHFSVEWKHLEEHGKTCNRCSNTGKIIMDIIRELKDELKERNINVTFTETKLSRENVAESNSVFFNGVAIEDILPDINISKNFCASCSCITEKETYCRTIEYKGKTYEEIDETIIRKAIWKTVNSI